MFLPLVGFACGDAPYFRYALSRLIPALDETDEIKGVITEFNNRFMDIYASRGDKSGVGAIPATVGVRHSLVKDAGSLWMGGRVLVYDIAALDFRSVKRESPVKASAIVNEEWNYQYKDEKTYKDMGNVHGGGALFRYQLVKQGGRWLVQKFEPVREVKKGA